LEKSTKFFDRFEISFINSLAGNKKAAFQEKLKDRFFK